MISKQKLLDYINKEIENAEVERERCFSYRKKMIGLWLLAH
jgi:hypothetical protein